MWQALTGSILIGGGLLLLWVFTSIHFKGIFKLIEPNDVILFLEMIMSLAIVTLGILTLYNSIRR